MAVLSVFGRMGAVVAVAADYAASQISNDSGVTGTFVKQALDNLAAAIALKADAAATTAALALKADKAITATAGAGMTGSGTLGANFTFDVVAGDATLTVGANSMVVGTVPGAQVSNGSAVAGASVNNALDTLLAALVAATSAGETWTPALNQLGGWRTTMASATVLSIGIVGVNDAGGIIPVSRTIANTNYLTKRIRAGLPTTAVAGTIGGIRGNNPPGFYGDIGHTEVFRFGLQALSANSRAFVGITAVNPIANVNPNTLTNCVGVGFNVGSGNLQMYNNDAAGTATQVDLGANFPVSAGAVYEVQIRTLRGGASVQIRIARLDITGVTPVTATLVADIPVATTPTNAMLWITNNTDASIVAIDFLDATFAFPSS